MLTSYAQHPSLGLPTEDIEHRLDRILVSRLHGVRLIKSLRRHVEGDGMLFGGRPLPTFPKPHVISAEDEDRWGAAAERLIRLFESAGHALLADRSLRSRLSLPPGSDELLEIDPGYSRLAVVARFDMVWSGRHVRVLELNADSPAMMTFCDRVETILLGMEPLGELLEAHGVRSRNRTRSLHAAMVATYLEWGGTRRDPTIAIVDWQGEATANELQHTAAEFQRCGSPTIVCDPRELSIEDGKLHARGHRIDIVQRRVLFPDFIRRASELQVLVDAYRGGMVCMVNPLRSYVVGNKVALSMMHENVFTFFPRERSLIEDLLPTTEIVTPDSLDRLMHEREDWVLKGAFGSGGKDVTIGENTPADEWAVLLARATTTPSVVQRLERIPRYSVPTETPGGDIELTELYANWNPWVFAGRYAGGLTRVSRAPIVVISGGGGLLPSCALARRTLEPRAAIGVDEPLARVAAAMSGSYSGDAESA